MGRIQTVGYWDNIPVRDFSAAELAQYSRDWQNVLAHPLINLLKSDVIGTEGVLIAENPVRIRASSHYGIVVYVTASFSNPDFTDTWRLIPFNDPKSKLLKELKEWLGRVVAAQIVPKWFPDLIGIERAMNVWPIRLDSTFVVVPPQAEPDAKKYIASDDKK